MAVPGGGVIEVGIEGSLLNQQTLTVLHYRVAAAAPTLVDTLTELDGLLAILNDNTLGGWKQNLRLLLPENFQFVRFSAQEIFPGRSRRVKLAVADSGLAEGTEISNVQLSFTKVTARGGRDQIGGIRLPATTAQAEAGRWNDLYLTRANNWADNLLAPIGNPTYSSIYQLCIYHRAPGALPKSDDVQDITVQPTTRVIRRRTVGVGV